jgi:hypothetical protein
MSDKRVLDVWQAKDQEHQKVVVHKNNGGTNQKWRVQYLDEVKSV